MSIQIFQEKTVGKGGIPELLYYHGVPQQAGNQEDNALVMLLYIATALTCYIGSHGIPPN